MASPEDPPAPETLTPGQRRSLRDRARRTRLRADDLAERAASRLERERARRSSVRLAFEFYQQDRDRAGGLLAGGVAFRVFLWFLPFTLVLVTGLGYATSVSDTSAERVVQRAGMSAALTASVTQAVADSHRGRLLLLPAGVFFLVVAGAGVVRALRVVSGLAWGVRPPAGGNALVRSLAFSGVVMTLLVAQGVAARGYGGPGWTDLLASLGLIAAFTAVVAWGLLHLPNPGVPWTAVVPGALLTALGIEGLRLVTAVYFVGKLSQVSNLYGAAGLSAVLLTWLYFLGRLVVAGTALNAAIWRQRSIVGAQPAGGPDSPGAEDAADVADEPEGRDRKYDSRSREPTPERHGGTDGDQYFAATRRWRTTARPASRGLKGASSAIGL